MTAVAADSLQLPKRRYSRAVEMRLAMIPVPSRAEARVREVAARGNCWGQGCVLIGLPTRVFLRISGEIA